MAIAASPEPGRRSRFLRPLLIAWILAVYALFLARVLPETERRYLSRLRAAAAAAVPR